MKSEPSEFSVGDLEAQPNQTIPWFGVRNYQARNFMLEKMKVNDRAFFYHSSCEEPGIVGITKVSKPAYPDVSQFDPKSKYYDPKASRQKPRWFNIEVKLIKKTRLVTLQELRSYPVLTNMKLLARGNRLSITPVTSQEWQFIMKIL